LVLFFFVPLSFFSWLMTFFTSLSLSFCLPPCLLDTHFLPWPLFTPKKELYFWPKALFVFFRQYCLASCNPTSQPFLKLFLFFFVFPFLFLFSPWLFSGVLNHSVAGPRTHLITSRDRCACVCPCRVLQALPTGLNRHDQSSAEPILLRPHCARHRPGAGILTCLPSPTPFGLGLGSD
jgi:hypothetical protein